MGTGFGDAVEGWIVLGKWWVDSWGTHVNKIATKVDSRTYTAKDAAADLVDCAYLAAESTFLVGSEVVDAATLLSGKQHQPVVTTSGSFRALTNAASERRIRLDGPLTSALASRPIPALAVTILPEPEPKSFTPSHLPANVAAFRLRFDATGFDGVAYLGSVSVFDAASNARLETVAVWVQVP